MSNVMQLSGKVYHATARANLPMIMVDGLKPLAKNRTREIQVVDLAFDIVAEAKGVRQRRTGIFAWHDKESTHSLHFDSAILEVAVDPCTALVLHQAWMDLAWGIVEGILVRVPSQHKDKINALSVNELFEQLIHVQIYEGTAGEVLSELGLLYWGSGVRLADYNVESAHALTDKVIQSQRLFSGLMPGVNHEVALGVEPIPKERLALL
ncbi:MAG: hypothetical protein Q7S22_04195 [Candidatus Micrarchaeota archaeon]|nr:hypothetical protein [Candidatus Micrarchaeota archaeon]